MDLYRAAQERQPPQAYGVALEGATWQTDWFFNFGLWPNATIYAFPYADMVGTFIMNPTGPESSMLRFGYYAVDGRPMPEVTKACIRWMNEDLGPEDIRLNQSNQKGLRSFGFERGRLRHRRGIQQPQRAFGAPFSQALLRRHSVLSGRGRCRPPPRSDIDYVIVGAGSAGCVFAARLTEDSQVRVLLLEAGPHDRQLAHLHAVGRRQSAELGSVQLELCIRPGAAPRRPPPRASAGSSARWLLVDQRHGLHPRPRPRLRWMGASGPEGVELCRCPAVFQACRATCPRR